MLNVRLLIVLGLAGALFQGSSLGQDKFSTGRVKWEVLEKKTISLSQQGLSSVLNIDPKLSAPDPNMEERTSSHDVSTISYASDITLNQMASDEEGNFVFETRRNLKFFPSESQGLRVLDMINRRGGRGTRMATVSYRTQFAEKGSIKATQVSNPTGDKGALALLLIPRAASQPVTILYMGGMDDEWTRKIDAGEDYVEWSYSGPLAMGQDFMLLHTVAFCENAEPKTVAAALEKLVNAKGMPADPSLSGSIHRQLLNYPVTLKKPEDEAPADAEEKQQLVWLDRVLESLNLKRPVEKDLLQLDGGESVQGTFLGSTMKVGDQELKQEDVAAILGTLGTRQSRVFLRDGRVLRGRLEWPGAKFESESLGEIVLKAESPGRIVLRQGKNDGLMSPKPVAWMADGRDGEVQPMKALPQAPLSLRWLGGVKSVPWQEVVSVRALPAPALEHELILMNGSRWRGWIEWDASLGMAVTHLGRDMPALLKLLEEAAIAPVAPTQPNVVLQDGSMIVGEMMVGKLSWHRQTDAMEIKTGDIAEVKRLPASDDDAASMFELTMKNNTKLTGHPQESALTWKSGAETLRLPWAWIQSLQITPLEAVKKP